MKQDSLNCEIFEKNGKLTNPAWNRNVQISILGRNFLFCSLSVMKPAALCVCVCVHKCCVIKC